MAEITAGMVKELREKSGAPMMDCKKALAECQGDMAKAEEYLRKKGISGAAKKQGRITAEGLVGTYVHNGKIGVIVEVPPEVLEKEKEIQRHQLREQKKPEAIWEKIIAGKLEKFYETYCLLDQPWIKDDKKKIQDLITEKIAKIGENLAVRRFVRFEVGEGLEKRKEDLAAEVAKTLGGDKVGSPPGAVSSVGR